MYRSTKKFAFEDEDSNDEVDSRQMKNHSIVGARRIQKPVLHHQEEEEEESEPSSESESEISSESEPSESESDSGFSESEDEDSDHEQNYRKYRKY